MSALIHCLRASLTIREDGEGADAFMRGNSPEALRGIVEAPNHHGLVAEDEGVFAGFIVLMDESYLAYLFVAPSHQGRGVARRLWESAVEAARQRGHAGGYTVNASLGARPVYERFGFRPMAPKVEKDGVAYIPMRLGRDEHDNERLVRDFCALYRLQDPESIGRGAALAIGSVNCSITSSRYDEAGTLTLYAEFGAVPEGSEQVVYEQLLALNHAEALAGGWVFGFSPLSRRVVCFRHLRSCEVMAPRLLEMLQDVAAQAERWREALACPLSACEPA
jgi:GNAT superfamily N-acetyltransferase